MLILIKTFHTVVWAFFVGCIAGIYVFAGNGNWPWAFGMIGIVGVEVVVLVLNRMRCPLTPIAARFTEARSPNFDIYLPRWLAKNNKEVFGTLYALGIVYTVLMWARKA